MFLNPDVGERLAGLQFVGPGSLSRPSLAWEADPDTGIRHRGVQGEFSFVSNGVEVGRITADGILLSLFTPGSVLFAGTDGTISEDTGLTFAAATDLLTITGGVVTPALGPTVAQQHTLPAVASDTVALIAASQTFTNKTLASAIVTTELQFNGATPAIDVGTTALIFRNNVGSSELMRLTDGGILALGTTVTAGAAAGDMIISAGVDRLQIVNTTGTAVLGLIGINTSDELALNQISGIGDTPKVVSAGAVDTGGTGFRILRIPN